MGHRAAKRRQLVAAVRKGRPKPCEPRGGSGVARQPGARALQGVLHERPWNAAVLGRDLPFGPGSADPQNEPAYLLAPTEHARGLDHDADVVPRAFMFLFGGEILIALPMPDAPVPDDERIWLVPAGGTPHGPLTGMAMLEHLRSRQ